jgi:hypothetical protein
MHTLTGNGAATLTPSVRQQLGVSPGTAMRHAFLGSAGWSAYAARRHPHTLGDETPQ